MAQAQLTKQGYDLAVDEDLNKVFPGITRPAKKKSAASLVGKTPIKQSHKYAQNVVSNKEGILFKAYSSRTEFFTLTENKKGEIVTNPAPQLWVVARKTNGKPFVYETDISQPEKV